MMINLVILKESAAGLFITLVVTSVSGFGKFQKPGKWHRCHSQKGDCARDRKVLCTAEEMSGILQSKLWPDLDSPALWYLVCPSGVTTEQWARGTAHTGDKGIYQAPAFPSAPSLIPSGAVQTQSYLHHLFKTRAAMEKCLSPVPSAALPCALAEGCLSLSEAGNHVHETFITSDFGRTSYKMWNLCLKKQFPTFKVIAAPFVLRANAHHCPKFTLIKDTLHHVSIPASPGFMEISFMFSFRLLWWSKSKFLLKSLWFWGNAGVMDFINMIFFHFQNYKRSWPDKPQKISEWVSGVAASLQSGKTSHIHHFQVTGVVCSYWNIFRCSKFQQISCPSCFQLSASNYSQF